MSDRLLARFVATYTDLALYWIGARKVCIGQTVETIAANAAYTTRQAAHYAQMQAYRA